MFARLFRTLALAALAATASASELGEQRLAFQEAYPQAELGIWSMTDEREALLRRYVLWPDLRAAFLRKRLDHDEAEIKAFLEHYQLLKPARELRFRYALSLAKRGNYEAFLQLYDRYYRQLGVARLDCLALRAEFDTLTQEDAAARLRSLWLVGQSQVKECDPLFAKLNARGLLDESLYRERFELAIDARELAIARYLARSLSEEFQLEAARWTRAYGLPQRFVKEHDPNVQTSDYRRQLLTAVRQLAYNDPELASAHWQDISARYAFDDAERTDIEQHVALWYARNHHADAYAVLMSLPVDAVDDEVLRWRVRCGLRLKRWKDVIEHIQAMSDPERETPQWKYWNAVALQQVGNRDDATRIFEDVAVDRSYYGFLAADAVNTGYAYDHQNLVADEAVLRQLSAQPQLLRARELFMVGLDGRGRSEWDAAISSLGEHEQVQAAILAHRWGWHSRAIATAALNQRFDDLVIRYPIPYADAFDSHAKAAGIRPSWALGIARSESLFMPDIRSSAGAIGVMQLMPATGRRTAKEIGLPYKGRVTLTDPTSNIRLGTRFLANMQARFANHPVLATAAYNAGPHRVDAWLPDSDTLDARIWIEMIPYAETRGYVRRVLMADTIFHWRMAGETSRLSAHLQAIPPQPAVASVTAD